MLKQILSQIANQTYITKDNQKRPKGKDKTKNPFCTPHHPPPRYRCHREQKLYVFVCFRR